MRERNGAVFIRSVFSDSFMEWKCVLLTKADYAI